jgi:hypothetical protein
MSTPIAQFFGAPACAYYVMMTCHTTNFDVISIGKLSGVGLDSVSVVSPTFSTRGVSDPGSRSRWTSWLKGLHYRSCAPVFSSNLPADLDCMALRMEGAVMTNDFNHKSRAGK